VFNLSLKEEEREKAAEAMPDGPPVTMVAELDEATGATLAVKRTNSRGETRFDLAATEVKANTGLDKKLFTYSRPEGMQFFDRTKPPEPEKKEQ